ncbi:hypothetical protein [Methylobacterium sp. SD21]|uniref:hypothetical protein n=1 Tax=Methylobacterium litchii TaxID=3138810 RepID=UPI00313B88B7
MLLDLGEAGEDVGGLVLGGFHPERGGGVVGLDGLDHAEQVLAVLLVIRRHVRFGS